ncbi:MULTISPECIES: hypothetical protein [unclassified Fusibacter]|uniref:hypothetical protein n=1 Tax=unclassified Fusibacter TaxID=2624464 RepID=UPI001010808E|nr:MULTISPECIES: hypothetical protein [unclassified Fusibacter]MCK8060255.1 hypothetical protein [Fusibacter sp. A2]NPE20457.1 hypothetical protein [Fusibacter sp. A1]RXV63662.1 hypothetical protein DWB64_01405 [Fusibacter sp. A1]
MRTLRQVLKNERLLLYMALIIPTIGLLLNQGILLVYNYNLSLIENRMVNINFTPIFFASSIQVIIFFFLDMTSELWQIAYIKKKSKTLKWLVPFLVLLLVLLRLLNIPTLLLSTGITTTHLDFGAGLLPFVNLLNSFITLVMFYSLIKYRFFENEILNKLLIGSFAISIISISLRYLNSGFEYLLGNSLDLISMLNTILGYGNMGVRTVLIILMTTTYIKDYRVGRVLKGELE